MQPPTPAPPGPPTPPAAPGLPAPSFPGAPRIAGAPGTADGVRYTPRDLAGLRARRTELSSQLTSAADRRDELARELVGKTGADRAGVEERLAVLDQRIVSIEREMAETGQQVALAAGAAVTVASPRSGDSGGLGDGQITAIAIVFTLAVLMPMALAYARLLWKRASAPRVAPAQAEHDPRIERIEHAVDAIAIEVERVSEGQRFVTQLLAEARGLVTPARLGGGEGVAAAQPATPPALHLGASDPAASRR